MKWMFSTIVLVPRGEWGAFPAEAERRRVFEWAAGAGFEGVELSPRWLDFHALSSAELSTLRREIESAGLRVAGLNISRCILTRVSEAGEHLNRLRRGILAAGELGGEILTLSLSMPTLPTDGRPPVRGEQVPEEERRRTAELLDGLAVAAQKSGADLSLELHDDGLLDTPELVLDMLRRIGHQSVGVNPDLGNVCRDPGRPCTWPSSLQALAPYANNWHVKNYRRGQPSPVWDGDIDYSEAIQIMLAAGYEGWVGIESYFGDALDLQARSLEWLKRTERSLRLGTAAALSGGHVA